MPRRTQRTRRNRRHQSVSHIVRRPATTYTRRRLSASAAEFIPSWLRNAPRVVSNGINSLLREINTKRRRSLGETRKSR